MHSGAFLLGLWLAPHAAADNLPSSTPSMLLSEGSGSAAGSPPAALPLAPSSLSASGSPQHQGIQPAVCGSSCLSMRTPTSPPQSAPPDPPYSYSLPLSLPPSLLPSLTAAAASMALGEEKQAPAHTILLASPPRSVAAPVRAGGGRGRGTAGARTTGRGWGDSRQGHKIISQSPPPHGALLEVSEDIKKGHFGKMSFQLAACFAAVVGLGLLVSGALGIRKATAAKKTVYIPVPTPILSSVGGKDQPTQIASQRAKAAKGKGALARAMRSSGKRRVRRCSGDPPAALLDSPRSSDSSPEICRGRSVDDYVEEDDEEMACMYEHQPTYQEEYGRCVDDWQCGTPQEESEQLDRDIESHRDGVVRAQRDTESPGVKILHTKGPAPIWQESTAFAAPPSATSGHQACTLLQEPTVISGADNRWEDSSDLDEVHTELQPPTEISHEIGDESKQWASDNQHGMPQAESNPSCCSASESCYGEGSTVVMLEAMIDCDAKRSSASSSIPSEMTCEPLSAGVPAVHISRGKRRGKCAGSTGKGTCLSELGCIPEGFGQELSME